MLTHVYLEKVVPTHSHENEQLTYILEGALRFWLGEDGSEIVDVAAAKSCTSCRNPYRARATLATVYRRQRT